MGDEMFENPYEQKLADLRSGAITELTVSQADFLTFREVWRKMEDRMDFVGEAGLNGTVIYRYAGKME
ncbi:hypothetical protein RU97_GL002569 [Enterococcus canis]|uniref:Uncharacterized protein n=2 Tax=Enterococcus canis TaxID=214095 RepID=A0A1L8RCS1_9ENTE|nr:hypothetical protein RU97_GL002569 [Enterococcus canis]